MKRIFVIFACAAAFAFSGTSRSNAQSNECCDNRTECKKECDKTEKEAYCITLDTEGFIKRVADFNQSEWKYLGDKPAVVDFYADWCGPCRAIAPALEEIAKEQDGYIYIYKINVDNCAEIAEAFNISAIPTLLFIPLEGAPYKRIGGTNKAEIEKTIAEHCF